MDKLFFTEEHEMLRDMVRDFAENEVEPLAREMDKTENIPKGLIDKMGELGIMGIPVPEKYGGVGMILTCDILAMRPTHYFTSLNN